MIKLATRDTTHKIVALLVLLALFVFVFFPVFWAVSTSLKPNDAAFRVPPQWIPRTPTIENYVSQLQDRSGFLTYVMNGVFVAVVTMVVTTLAALPAGYTFARLKFRGKRSLLLVILSSQMFPPVLIVIALYTLYADANLLDTYLGLVISYTSYTLPFAVWMTYGFSKMIPDDIEESAIVDGCSRSRVLWQIVVPLLKPGLVAIGLFAFLHAWNNLIFALSLTSSPEMRTIPPGFLLMYVGEFQYRWGNMFAGSIIVSIPTIVLFIRFQRHLVKGMTAGAVKG